MFSSIIQPFLGIVLIVAIAFVLSENRQKIDTKRLSIALAFQFLLALFLIKSSFGRSIFEFLGKCFKKLMDSHHAGIDFVFGDTYSLGLRFLPMIIFVTALSSVLYHYRILQFLIHILAICFRKILGMSGPEAMGMSANIFLGMAEAPTLIAPYLKKMSRAQLFMVMVGGMATISGALLMFCADILHKAFAGGKAEAASQLLIASVISAPAAFFISRLLIPDSDSSGYDSQAVKLEEVKTTGFFDALSQGTFTGIKLTAYVVGMLIVIVALVKFIDLSLIYCFDDDSFTLSKIFGKLFKYPAWFLGIPIEDCDKAGQLLGTKVILNEVVAYQQMATMEFSSPKTAIILSYAMCGFANLGSIGIMIASMAGLCPERRSEIAGLGFKAMCGGFMAICLTGIMVAIIL